MTWTTRKPTYNVEKLFPFLKGTARTAIRLHPRQQTSLPPTISKVGGSIVWPRDEAQPVCRLFSCPAVPVIQLLKADFPSIKFPRGTDLLQILWYPRSYGDCAYGPKFEFRWRKSSRLSPDCVLNPVYEEHEDIFVVHECRIQSEPVIEYPYIDLLNEDQKQSIWDWEEDQNDPLAKFSTACQLARERKWEAIRSTQVKTPPSGKVASWNTCSLFRMTNGTAAHFLVGDRSNNGFRRVNP